MLDLKRLTYQGYLLQESISKVSFLFHGYVVSVLLSSMPSHQNQWEVNIHKRTLTFSLVRLHLTYSWLASVAT